MYSISFHRAEVDTNSSYHYVESRNVKYCLFFLNASILDDMGNRIDDLEKNIADLMTQAGVEVPDK